MYNILFKISEKRNVNVDVVSLMCMNEFLLPECTTHTHVYLWERERGALLCASQAFTKIIALSQNILFFEQIKK